MVVVLVVVVVIVVLNAAVSVVVVVVAVVVVLLRKKGRQDKRKKSKRHTSICAHTCLYTFAVHRPTIHVSVRITNYVFMYYTRADKKSEAGPQSRTIGNH